MLEILRCPKQQFISVFNACEGRDSIKYDPHSGRDSGLKIEKMKSAGKVMSIIFYYVRQIVNNHMVQAKTTVNSEYY